MTVSSEPLLTPEQAAERLGLHVKTVRRHIREGRLTAVQVGKRYRIPREALEAFSRAPLESPVAQRPLTEASTILGIDGVSRRAADRLTTLLLASAREGHGRDGSGPLRVECVHYPERSRLKVVCHGDLAGVLAVLALANLLLEDRQ